MWVTNKENEIMNILIELTEMLNKAEFWKS